MKKTVILLLMLLTGFSLPSKACTNIMVGKDASADGSVFCTYCCDSYGLFYGLAHYPAAKYAPGTQRQLISCYSRKPKGVIPEAAETYNVVGNINEWQVSIAESTFNVDKSLVDSTGMMDHTLMMLLALQRAKTAREAIKVMTDLVEKYGYSSQGESFSVCDPNEAWLLEVVSQGPGSGKAVWVAVRIPDNAICAHANESRITRFNMKDKKNVMYHKDVIKYARESGRFSGKDSEFSFRDAYNKPGFSGRRMCDARVWSFYNRHCKGMEKYLPYILGEEDTWEDMPIWVVPDKKLTLQDVQAAMRDHYEGTPLEHGEDITRGLTNSPYPQGIGFTYQKKKYFNERYIASPQSAFSWVTQMRSWLPREIGGIIWFGNDEANMVAQTPFYCCATRTAPCYDIHKTADDVTFSMDNAFWVSNWVANMVYARYGVMFKDLKQVRDSLDNSYQVALPAVEAKAAALLKTNRDEAIEYLTAYSVDKAQEMLARWQRLAFFLIVKYNDMAEKPEKDGVFLRNQYGRGEKVKRLEYPEYVKRAIAEQTGERYMNPSSKKKK